MMSLRKAFLILGLFSVASAAEASLVVLNGNHFTASYESTQTGLYDQGLLSGSQDTVYFQPTTFSALSGGSPASTQGLLQLTFTIDTGYTFAGLSFAERGDYFLFGNGSVDVAASVQAVNAASSASTLLSLAPGSLLSQGGSTPWALTGSISPVGLGSPQTLVVTLDNTLTANAAPGSLGFIQKTYAGFQVLTRPVPVPEPSSGSLLLAGLLAALLVGGGRNVRVRRQPNK
ncbi:MAG: PEP-CTERM sorting domain-containing protein [Thiobacillus sp.]